MNLFELLLVAAVAVAPEGQALKRFEASQRHMGVSFTIVLYAADRDAANEAFRSAFGRIEALNGIMSDYDGTSELSRLSAAAPTAEPVELSDDLFEVLQTSLAYSRKTDGAFDVTVGPLTKLWRRARRKRELPADDRLQSALAAVGYQSLRINGARKTAELLKKNMRLDLGGIAKGYAVDQALNSLRCRGIRRALVNGSGDIGASDPPPGKRGWKIGIAPLEAGGSPSRFLLLANSAVATSGDAFQFVEIGGRRYSHILDPRAGLGLTDHSSVTVVAPSCTAADALASSVSVLGPKAGLKLIESTDNAAVLILRAPNGKVEIHESDRFGELPRP